VAAFTADEVSGCSPLEVHFTDQSTGDPISWTWNFGDGSPLSYVQNPIHVYSPGGSYTVSLTVSDGGDSDTETKIDYITVLLDPLAGFTADPTSGDPPLTVYFTDQSTGAASWTWDFGDGSPLNYVQHPSHVYQECGVYDVTLTVTNECGSDEELKPGYISVCGTCYTLSLSSGWNFVSLNLSPDPPDILTVLAPIITEVSIIKGRSGFCIPGGACALTDWDCLQGYKIHMQSAQSLEVCGSPCSSPIPLLTGWNWISCLPDCCLDAADVMQPVVSCLVILKGMRGFYLPPNNFLGDMCPGEGYSAYMSCDMSLVYPTCSSFFGSDRMDNTTVPAMKPNVSHLGIVNSTADYHPVVVETSSLLAPGDEVGIYTSSDILVGSGVYEGGTLAISAWADDPQTLETDGWIDGDVMDVRLWKSVDGAIKEFPVEILEGSLTFGASPYTVIRGRTSKTVTDTPELSLLLNYPNPFNPQTTIEFAIPYSGHIELSVYNITGQKVRILAEGIYTAGKHQIVWDGKDSGGNTVSSGIYFYHLATEHGAETKKMMLVK